MKKLSSLCTCPRQVKDGAKLLLGFQSCPLDVVVRKTWNQASGGLQQDEEAMTKLSCFWVSRVLHWTSLPGKHGIKPLGAFSGHEEAVFLPSRSQGDICSRSTPEGPPGAEVVLCYGLVGIAIIYYLHQAYSMLTDIGLARPQFPTVPSLTIGLIFGLYIIIRAR